MKNITMNVNGNKLLIEIDLTKEFGLSSSGKTTIVATTEGNTSVPNHADIKIGVNVYKK
jgi:ABC-type molybdate transport system ATPase subunit